MKNNKMMKTMISTACAAVLAVGLMGGSATAAPAQQNNVPSVESLQADVQKWLQNNGGVDIFKLLYQFQSQIQCPGAGHVTMPQKPEKPETSKPETSKPETSKPETSKPETSKPETSKPETSKPETSKPETSKPETSKPETSKPETSKPETSKPETSKPSETTKPDGSTSNQSSFAAEVIKLVNQERANAGLKPLTENAKLSNMAMDKAKDMSNNHYFDHNSPTYGSPFDMMKQYGISYSYAGENIAQGQRTPSDVMNAWMNSQGHRANILSANFTTIGVAYYNGYWVQEFIAN
ncbi:CAP domain-containing protein [Paenibacillus sp.]|jgi:uncharacterized YkwD family protein|uniref:CAP domain-containing protein n=1 Tax=Paenibacillus sp. TaxID=58172 RepID=UPI00281992D0|nr:CAP domain-containing protein [Paenibacillus sp.]MDR0270696.1 CAP domain-containing protein [Paenibacillus sp.]